MSDESLTGEQTQFADRDRPVFLEACPGAGKTRAVVARVARISKSLKPRMGNAVLSFTNSAVDAFVEQCTSSGLNALLSFPSFVGTFDAFVRQFFILPGGIAGVDVRPTVVESWKNLDIQVRLGGTKAFRGEGVDLDNFDPQDNHIVPEQIGHHALQAHVKENQPEYSRAAARIRNGLRGKGYLSAADARVEALKKMADKEWSAGLGRALSRRFYEVIVDEAQDCNPVDLEILRWLRTHGLSVTTVCDPDQAIYEFRYGDPAKLRDFSHEYGIDDRLPLTGNFRSSEPICSLAATLREPCKPDDAVGPNAKVNLRVQILTYQGSKVHAAVGHRFCQMLKECGLGVKESIVLAHSRNAALRATGLTSISATGGSSRVETMAKAIGEFWSSSGSNRARESALRTVEKIILSLMGKIEPDELPRRAVERQGIDSRWLRRTALELLMRIPKSCSNTNAGCAHWLATLHAEVKRLSLDYADKVSEKAFFRRPTKTEWCKHLNQTDVADLRCSTIHEAKGREYEAVCVIIPADRAPFNYTTQLFQAWQARTNFEGKRVVYVGVTRARKLVALAVPATFRERLIAILSAASVQYEIHNISASAVVKESKPTATPT